MTISLIAINTFIEIAKPLYLSENMTMWQYWEFAMRFYFTPNLILAAEGPGVLSSITSMFMHANFFHLLSNMGALWVFGRRVEDACGAWRFFVFYLLAGISSGLITALAMYNSPTPGVGASGAIFGVMGAYLLLYPAGRIRTLVIISFVPAWPRIRAGWIVLYFLAVQIIPALNILFSDGDYGVGYWAHLGGFFSALFIFLFLRPEAFARYLSETPV
ncbi:MAG: rhomboid family intramembrane serine protease [Anaerolineales bacterium]